MLTLIMMKKRALSLLLVLTVFWLACCSAAGGREKLETNILELLQGFNGDVGVFVRHLPSKTVVGVNENKIFPTASM
ncbi:MAG TPA: hypothetical protein QGF17_05690, partial [Candidatus Marinimicrobia bacterium]|nr:hypothetical protein [Candidatus Neomarinimicrobiota bacterium]